MRKKILKIYASILAIGIPYYIFVSLTNLGIPCPIYELTGLLCGGCGASRMFMAMLKFEFAEAFGYNMALFPLFFIWNAIALFLFIGKPAFFRNKKFLSFLFYISVAALFIFMILRNII